MLSRLVFQTKDKKKAAVLMILDLDVAQLEFYTSFMYYICTTMHETSGIKCSP